MVLPTARSHSWIFELLPAEMICRSVDWVSTRGHGPAADQGHVSSQRQLQFVAGEVPDLDHSVSGAGNETLVADLERDTPDLAHVAGDDPVQFP